MIGAIIGDIVGSRFEFNGNKRKDVELFTEECSYTDDTIMTLAVAECLIKDERGGKEVGEYLRKFGRLYPNPMGGYGGRFAEWLMDEYMKPYGSKGNGSAMRCSAAGWIDDNPTTCARVGRHTACTTHNSFEGERGARIVSQLICMARNGSTKKDIEEFSKSSYNLDFTVDSLRPYYHFEELCETTVPVAIRCVLDADSFEDAIRNAVSMGGDADTLCAITGSIAEPLFGVPEWMREKALEYLPDHLKGVLEEFEEKYGR